MIYTTHKHRHFIFQVDVFDSPCSAICCVGRQIRQDVEASTGLKPAQLFMALDVRGNGYLSMEDGCGCPQLHTPVPCTPYIDIIFTHKFHTYMFKKMQNFKTRFFKA